MRGHCFQGSFRTDMKAKQAQNHWIATIYSFVVTKSLWRLLKFNREKKWSVVVMRRKLKKLRLGAVM